MYISIVSWIDIEYDVAGGGRRFDDELKSLSKLGVGRLEQVNTRTIQWQWY